MKFLDIHRLAIKNLLLNPGRSILTMLGIIISMSLTVFFISLSLGIKQAALIETFKSFERTQIKVQPDYFQAGIFEIEKKRKIQLNDEAVTTFSSIEGVTAVYPQVTMQIPTSARIFFGDYSFESDAFVYGIDPEVVKDIPSLYQKFSQTSYDVLPVILNRRLLDLYNTSVTASSGLPRVTEAAVTGHEIDLILNYSTFVQTAIDQKNQSTIRAKIIGFSERVPLMGTNIPLQEAQNIINTYQNSTSNAGQNYHTIYVQAEKVEDIPRISKAIEDMGFDAQSAQETIEQIQGILQYFFIIFSILTGIVLFVSMSSIINTVTMSVLSRIKEIGILRACGAEKHHIAYLFLSESCLLGVIGTTLGIIVGMSVSYTSNSLLLSLIPDLSYKPTSLFLFQWWIIPVTYIIGISMSALAGIFPARRAAKLDPITALSSN